MVTPSQQTEALPTGGATQADPARASKTVLDLETERAARAFMKRIADLYSVREAILFGSRARRTIMRRATPTLPWFERASRQSNRRCP